jgi:peptidoglycan/xylan/chitin deacetylase (PgdA/CDA1 family)
VAAATAGLAAWGAYHPASQVFGATLRRLPEKFRKANAIALTFDDGPNPAVTPRLLNVLAQHDARATFFLIGDYVRAASGVAREIAARGHAIGNHTATHPSLLWLSQGRIGDELRRCEDEIAEAAGRRAEWMRPPYGYRSPQMHAAVRGAGMRGVAMWSRHARDWRQPPAAEIIERLRVAQPGDIVLLHDGAPPEARGAGREREATLAGVAHWLPRWKEQGWSFVTLDEV